MSTATAPAATGVAPKDNRWIVLAIVCVGQLMVILDATIVNVALPEIQADLNLTDQGLQWIVNGYTLAFGGFLLLGGRLGDIVGRRSVFIAGVALFTLASLLNGLATNEGQLIAFRGLQGLGGALLSPAALSIISTEFHGKERATALSVWGAIAGAGAAIGLLLGGVILETLSWEWIFFVNVPIGLLVILAAVTQIQQSKAEDAPALDVAGAITATGGLVLLVFAIVSTSEDGWGSTVTLLRLAAAIALLVIFGFIESRHRDPLVPLGIFKVRSVSSANLVGLLAFGAIFAQFFFLSLFLQKVRNYGPLETGVAFLPFSVSIILTAGFASQLVPKIGVKLSACIGTGMAAIGMLLLGLVISPTTPYFPSIIGPMIILAIGMGMTFVPLTFLATSNVEPSKAGLASGLFNTTQQVGGALGLAILSALAVKKSADGIAAANGRPLQIAEALVDGWSLAFLVGAGLLALAFIVALLRIRDEDAEFDGPGDDEVALV